ncbi:MAG: PspC domain-containing protein [Spirochaetaceae bacterium]|nr:PspC domain-containing protein [Spirochaetaceae bacterium]
MTKRLYKSQNRLIAGVCAGLAEYFNLDPTIVRLIFIILLFCSVGFIIPAYIIGMIIIPDRPFSSNDQYRYEENMKAQTITTVLTTTLTNTLRKTAAKKNNRQAGQPVRL